MLYNVSTSILMITVNIIDGRLLMAMNDSDFEHLLVDAPPLQRKAFNMSLSSVRDLGIKPPANIWEFKVNKIP